jgi:hypothetical protein
MYNRQDKTPHNDLIRLILKFCVRDMNWHCVLDLYHRCITSSPHHTHYWKTLISLEPKLLGNKFPLGRFLGMNPRENIDGMGFLKKTLWIPSLDRV